MQKRVARALAARRPHCVQRLCSKKIASTAGRSDDMYVAILQSQLADTFDASRAQFTPVWNAMTNAVASNHLAPQTFLDLASGHGEPACSLARRFHGVTVVASDSSEEERQRANTHIAALGLSDRVTVEPIDLSDLHVFADLEASGEELPQCDVVTCSFGLFMLPPSQHEACLRGVRALLRPGGLLVASVWEHMALLELSAKCVGMAVGTAPPPLPFDPNGLGGGAADALLDGAGFEVRGLSEHNGVSTMELRLGARGSDEAFMLGLVGHVSVLHEISQRGGEHVGVFGRAQAAFDDEVEKAGHVDASGDVVVPLRWRMLCGRRPL